MKVYSVNDLFYDSWADLNTKTHALVFTLKQQINRLKPSDEQYGFVLIKILRTIRKRKLLVDRLNVPQAVDIYNDLSFLNKPWYYFPVVKIKRRLFKRRRLSLMPPEDHMARHTFDHFIYADNEFTQYIASTDVKFLYRLLVTLYQMPGEVFFDKESVEERAAMVEGRVKEYDLMQVFYTFSQVRDFVVKRCKTLIPPPPKSEVEQKTKPTGAMWLQLKHRLAETPVFQGYDNAGRANMYAALDYLEDLAKQKADAKH